MKSVCLENKGTDKYDPTRGGLGTECPCGRSPPASATTQGSIRDSQLCWRVYPECAVSCGKTPALDHLPESVAGTAGFDSLPRSGSGSWVSLQIALACQMPWSQFSQDWVSSDDNARCANIPECHPGTIYWARLSWHQGLVIFSRARARAPRLIVSVARVRLGLIHCRRKT